jgi:hypothetical protein
MSTGRTPRLCYFLLVAAAAATCGPSRHHEPEAVVAVSCGWGSAIPGEPEGRIEGKLLSITGSILQTIDANGAGYIYDFTLAPTGDQILYCQLDPDKRQARLLLRRISGQAAVNVISLDRPHTLLSPKWSPDGRMFTAGIMDFGAEPVRASLQVFDAETLATIQTVENAVPIAWLSKKLLVAQVPPREYILLDLDSKGRRSISFEGALVGAIPELDRLVGIVRNGSRQQMYLVDPGTGEKRLLAEVDAFNVHGVSWDSASREAFFTRDKNPGLLAFDAPVVEAVHIDSGRMREVIAGCVTSGGIAQGWMVDTLYRLHYEGE